MYVPPMRATRFPGITTILTLNSIALIGIKCTVSPYKHSISTVHSARAHLARVVLVVAKALNPPRSVRAPQLDSVVISRFEHVLRQKEAAREASLRVTLGVDEVASVLVRRRLQRAPGKCLVQRDCTLLHREKCARAGGFAPRRSKNTVCMYSTYLIGICILYIALFSLLRRLSTPRLCNT